MNDPPLEMHPRRSDQVELYSSAPPEKEHTDVALLDARTDNPAANRSEMVTFLRETAAGMGCDALFIGHMSYPHNASKSLEATCIVYTWSSGEPAEGSVERREESPDLDSRTCRRIGQDFFGRPTGPCAPTSSR